MSSSVKEKITFSASAVLYLVCNVRLASTPLEAVQATAIQLLKTAPYVAGATFFLVALLQYMAGGATMPWNRRLRLFFAIGIIAALIYGIYEYAGQGAMP